MERAPDQTKAEKKFRRIVVGTLTVALLMTIDNAFNERVLATIGSGGVVMSTAIMAMNPQHFAYLLDMKAAEGLRKTCRMPLLPALGLWLGLGMSFGAMLWEWFGPR